MMPDLTKVDPTVGVWYLRSNGAAQTVRLVSTPAGGLRGTLLTAEGAEIPLDQISWNEQTCIWEFRAQDEGLWWWYRGKIVEDLFVGRCSVGATVADRPAMTAYSLHVTGWNSTSLDHDIVPRVYDMVLGGQERICLRLDRDEGGQLLGRFKVVAKQTGTLWDATGEEVEYDLEVVHWDGECLEFLLHGPWGVQTFTGRTRGNILQGTCVRGVPARVFSWTGVRAEVLGYGLTTRSAFERQNWQQHTRKLLMHLMLAGNPLPTAASWRVLATDVPPVPGLPATPRMRDDNPECWPQSYTRRELLFTYSLANPYGEEAMVRESHAWLAVPSVPPPREQGYRLVLALNGHTAARQGGGGRAMLDATDALYWYGDAFARRGFVVLALDISHRPLVDRAGLYQDQRADGDQSNAQGLHPALAAPEFPHDADWEEDGERVWDVLRALDLLMSGQLGVRIDPGCVLVTGLSLGGEIATLCGALDPRISLVIASGFAPDLQVLRYRKNHPCWQWMHADLLEYISVSDWHALIAPRALIVQTGLADATFSSFSQPFAGDRQILRRSRAAYGQADDQLIHYLHDGGHQYRVGDRLADVPDEPALGITLPVAGSPAPGESSSWVWQLDARTTLPALNERPEPTLFDYIDHFWA